MFLCKVPPSPAPDAPGKTKAGWCYVDRFRGMTAQQAQALHMNLTFVYSFPPSAGLLPVYLLPVVLLVVSAIFLIVGGQLGKGLEAAAAFFYTGMICFYMVDVLMEALSIHQCQVLEWCDAISLAPTAFAQDVFVCARLDQMLLCAGCRLVWGCCSAGRW